jgi:hypothetical protein
VMTNKVLSFAPPYNEGVPEDKNLMDCDCPCRHHSRMIVKDILTYEGF